MGASKSVYGFQIIPAKHIGSDGVEYRRVRWDDSDKKHPICNGDAAKCPDFEPMARQPVTERKADGRPKS